MLFPGQGAQYIGMCKDMVKNYPAAAQVFKEANDSLGYNIQKMINDGDMQELTHLANAQPAVVTASYALYKVLTEETGFLPDYGTGHSLGEISALIAAGGIAFYDGVRFARERGSIMQRAYSEKKGRTALILDITEEIVEKTVKEVNDQIGFASICCYNSPRQFVVSGDENALKALDKSVKKVNGEFVPFSMMPMKVDAPFHSTLMSFIEEDIKKELTAFVYHPLKWDVVSTVTGLPYNSHNEIEKNLMVQLVTPVRWRQAVSYFERQDVSFAFEIGPQSSMKGLFNENTKKIRCYSFDDKEDREKIIRFLLAKQLIHDLF